MLVETQIEDKNKKLALLRSGQKLVTPEQRERTERRYNTTQVRRTHGTVPRPRTDFAA